MGFEINLNRILPKAGWEKESSHVVSKWMSLREGVVTEAALKKLNIHPEKTVQDDKIRLSIPRDKIPPSTESPPKILPPLKYGATMSAKEAKEKLENYPIGTSIVYFEPYLKEYFYLEKRKKFVTTCIGKNLPVIESQSKKESPPKNILKHESKTPPIKYGETMSEKEAKKKLENYPIGTGIVYFNPHLKQYCCIVKRKKDLSQTSQTFLGETPWVVRGGLLQGEKIARDPSSGVPLPPAS